jgi:hypothetical protein
MLRNASNILRRRSSIFTGAYVQSAIRVPAYLTGAHLLAHSNARSTTQYVSARCFADVAKVDSRSGEPTIYALSTAAGRAGIAIVRISGSACLDASTILQL